MSDNQLKKANRVSFRFPTTSCYENNLNDDNMERAEDLLSGLSLMTQPALMPLIEILLQSNGRFIAGV